MSPLPALTYLASWRGQLVLSLALLVLGGVYFYLASAYTAYRASRRLRLSEARAAELLAGEDEPRPRDRRDKDEREREIKDRVGARERGREKRKEVKEGRKKMIKDTNEVVSGEGSLSPAPSRPTPSSSTPRKGKEVQPASDDVCPATLTSTDEATEGSARKAAPVVQSEPTIFSESPTVAKAPEVDEPPPPVTPPATFTPLLSDPHRHAQSPASSARGVSRPSSPAGPSSPAPPSRSQTFSIYPEEGYLPLSALASSSKKKKRKSGKTPTLTAAQLRSPAPLTRELEPDVSVSGSTSDDMPQIPTTPRHRRKVSAVAGIPLSPAFNTLLEGHEKTVDALRAEIGIAKAEESKAKDEGEKAREEVRRSRAAEEKMRAQWERTEKAKERADAESRKKDAELHMMQGRYAQLSQAYAGVIARLNGLEALMRDQGQPPSPAALSASMPAHSASMLGVGNLHQPVPSPLHSPFLPFPMASTPGYPYPSPGQGMFPPQMMHPYHPASPFRRASAAPSDVLAGPLTPGAYQSELPANTPSSGIMTSQVNGNGTHAGPSSGLTAADVRRISIEASVLKKKKTDDDSRRSRSDSAAGSVSSTGCAAIPEAVEGLGMGDIDPPPRVDGLQGSQAGSEPGEGAEPAAPSSIPGSSAPSVNGSETFAPESRPRELSPPSSASPMGPRSDASSPSPPRRLVTPAEIAIFAAANGDKPIRCVPDADGGNVYMADDVGAQDDAHDEHANGVAALNGHAEELKAALGRDGEINGAATTVDAIVDADANNSGDDGEPVFASLAHGPEQLAEIKRMRERAQARGRREVVA
ncbi:hypothetical protein Q5752_005348 [Cryptotrichosporon argae]